MKEHKRSWLRLCLLLVLLAAAICIPLAVTQTTMVKAAGKTGVCKIGNQKYYYEKGVRVTGWKKVGKRWYYCQPDKKGAIATGFQMIDGKRYAFSSRTGKNYTQGWHKINGRRYYVLKKGRLETGWLTKNGNRYFLKKNGKHIGAALTGVHYMGSHKQLKRTFGARGVLRKTEKITTSEDSDQLQTSTDTATLRNYLLEAMRAMGTNYILGGGWNCCSTDVLSSYDCSGYVGWVTWQFLQNQGSCWTKSYNIPTLYADNGWGSKRSHKELMTDNFQGQFRAGDIIRVQHDDGSTGHVWIVVGQCSDGSYVLLHCSGSDNNGCVQISGTPTPDNTVGEAYELARDYMTRYFPDTVSKYNLDAQGPYGTFCTDYYNYMGSSEVTGFRWDASVFSDPDDYAKQDAASILRDLFNES